MYRSAASEWVRLRYDKIFITAGGACDRSRLVQKIYKKIRRFSRKYSAAACPFSMSANVSLWTFNFFSLVSDACLCHFSDCYSAFNYAIVARRGSARSCQSPFITLVYKVILQNFYPLPAVKFYFLSIPCNNG